jgi:hypothetical protein
VTVDAGARTGEALSILEQHGTDFGPSGSKRYGSFDRVSAAASNPTEARTVGDPSLPGLDAAAIDAIDGARERRARQDPAYVGPERRLAGV